MKKYRIIVITLILVYVCISVSAYIYTRKQNDNMGNAYRIEINKIQNKIMKLDSITQPELDEMVENCEYVKEVNYTDADDVESQFFDTSNDSYYQINVLKDQSGKINGYLKYKYVVKINNSRILAIVEIYVAIVILVCLASMFYVYRKIIKPFNELSQIPIELSKGNLGNSIKENKSRYFGKFVWGISVLTDKLNEHKSKEYKLAKEKKLLVLSISHDIKTPLNAIMLYTKALRDGMYETMEEKIKAIDMIRAKALEIDGFVKDIVKSQTEDIISIDVEVSEIYLSSLVEKINKGYREKCELRHIRFSIAEYDDHILRADMDRLYEAVGNLIENALKYGDGVEISISFSEEEYCQLISVYNSGKCVEDNEVAHLFDSFFRGSNVEGKDGNGLGLYISNQIMHKMDGDIYLKRKSGGMEFTLVCPMC